MNRPLIIVGASTRAAAMSAMRAGFQPWLADIFADADLMACAPVRRIEPYPSALPQILLDAPEVPWMYTGAIENHWELIEQMASQRPLWGNSAAAVRQVRNPVRFAEVVRSMGFSVPEVRLHLNRADLVRSWVQKNARSAGGRNIATVAGDSPFASFAASHPGYYFQQRIVGQPVSAVYVAEVAETKLLGITAQLIGDDASRQFWCTTDWTGAKGYWYAGSIGPMTRPEWLIDQAADLGGCVADEFKLRGLFGIDAILTDDAIWPVEVNPRYTASIEVLERANGARAIEMHSVSFASHPLDFRCRVAAKPAINSRFGKAILYATCDTEVPLDFPVWANELNANSSWPLVADLPHGGTKISSGAPICTVFAAGATESEVICRMHELAAKIRAALRDKRM